MTCGIGGFQFFLFILLAIFIPNIPHYQILFYKKKHIVFIQLLNFLLSTPIINDLIWIFKTFKCNDWLISQPKAGWLGKYRPKRVNNRQLKI